MTDTQTTDAIGQHLKASPRDWQARLELADLFEETGEVDQAQYQRWLVEHRLASFSDDVRMTYYGLVVGHCSHCGYVEFSLTRDRGVTIAEQNRICRRRSEGEAP